jgi:hypothetical protein
MTYPGYFLYKSPADRKTCDQSIEFLSKAINKTGLGLSEKQQAFSRLNRMSIG